MSFGRERCLFTLLDYEAAFVTIHYFNTFHLNVSFMMIITFVLFPFVIRSTSTFSLARTLDAAALEALAVHDGRSSLVVLALGDPHLLERGQRGEDGTTDPHGVLTLVRSDNLNLHGGRR